MRTKRARAFGLVGCLAVLSAARVAAADSTSDPLAARTLFQGARKLVAQGKYEQACPKFEESLSLDPGIGTMFNLADCWEHVGRTASAWSKFLDAASAAKNAGQAEREKVARKRAAALEPRLSRLTVTAPAPDAGLEVHDGTRAIAASLYGTAVPVDPGPHTIEAVAPGKKRWLNEVQVAADGGTITVAVPALESDQPPAPPIAQVSAAPASVQGPAGDSGERSGSMQRTVGWITAGVGVAGLAVGTGFGLVASSKNSQAESLCVKGPCSQSEFDRHASLVDSATSARTGAIVGFAVGGAALLGGVALLLTAPRDYHEALAITPLAGFHQWGAAIEGAF